MQTLVTRWTSTSFGAGPWAAPMLGLVCLLCPAGAGGQAVGTRPYELEWACRTEDQRPPLVDFDDESGWTVEVTDSEATFTRSREQQLWGRHVGRLAYRGTGSQPRILVRRTDPLPIPQPFDCVNLWVYGNNWAWVSDPSTPRVTIRVLLESAAGQSVVVDLGQVRWKEWWLMHRRLTPDQLALLGSAPRFCGIEVLNGRNTAERMLYFDNLAIYQELLPPLQFAARRQRNIELPDGQTRGTNTGPERLPFPTRAETMLPSNLTAQFTTELDGRGDVFVFSYRGEDGQLTYTYAPSTGTLADVSAQWTGRGEPFVPLAGGGVYFGNADGSTAAPEACERISCRREGDTVVARWRVGQGARTAEVDYTLRLWQKSLVIDVACPGGEIGEFRIGQVQGVVEPRLVTLPYLTGAEQRPAVLVTGPVEQPLFTMALLDHCRSNSSLFWFANRVADDGTVQNGGSRYLPKTDGQRNACYERLFVTVSPQFEEVLPNVPNPQSPWMQETGRRVWRAHGASNRQQDYELWRKVARYGMSQMLITDHETGWRDGGESFTMRTRAAPGKGGDEGQAEYARKIRALGFRYGIYNNYTDYAPVNENWDEDYVTRTPDNQWTTAWARCYNPKPARAVEVEERLAPIIQEKFQLDTAYCDVHTAVRPWSYCDFDARVPGAGTFAATFYAYGEIMLHQKQTWNGPVYSEGNNHWYYCGLTDGNYGQDQLARLDVSPWLVDFDLRKLHPLCCNFGMGNLGMFYGSNPPAGAAAQDPQTRLDRFLAATLAFGHTGFLVLEGGFPNAVQSYFAVQQVHTRYAQQQVKSIQYADADGHLHETSRAVAAGLYRRSQVVTQYDDGLEVWVNGQTQDTWQTPHGPLPPNGWLVRDPQEQQLVAFSRLLDGHRVDYVDAPDYRYANGRGQLIRFDKAVCDGQLIMLPAADGTVELIPVAGCTVMGVSWEGRNATAVALDEAGRELGPASTRFSRGLVFVQPVANAFSYRLAPTATPNTILKCARDRGIPGEVIPLVGEPERRVQIPADAQVGSLFWYEADGAWLDFTVVPLATVDWDVDAAGAVHLSIVPHVAARTEATVRRGTDRREVTLTPGHAVDLAVPVPMPAEEQVRPLELSITAGSLEYHQTCWLKTEDAYRPLASWPDQLELGQCLRGQAERPLDARTQATVYWAERSCGNQSRRCLFMHPPYGAAVGYSFAVTEPLLLPADLPAALRGEVGKADGSDPGDGILFRIAVVDAGGQETVVAERSWARHAWTRMEADLSPWQGRPVRLKLIADVGPGNNSTGDWACWSRLRLESLEAVRTTTVHDQPVDLVREPGPLSAVPLGPKKLRAATGGKLHFQGIGLQNGPPYVSQATLNGVALGDLPAANGDPDHHRWSDGVLPLSAEAIAQLGEWNRLELQNPGGDSFKVRRFWIELQWADGTQFSSDVTRTVFSQPGSWRYAEGEGVPFDQDVTVAIRFRVR